MLKLIFKVVFVLLCVFEPFLFISPPLVLYLWTPLLGPFIIYLRHKYSWVDPITGRLNPSHAYQLNCRATTLVNLPGGGQQQVLTWGNDMGIVEAYLIAISNIVLGGVNPGHFA